MYMFRAPLVPSPPLRTRTPPPPQPHHPHRQYTRTSEKKVKRQTWYLRHSTPGINQQAFSAPPATLGPRKNDDKTQKRNHPIQPKPPRKENEQQRPKKQPTPSIIPKYPTPAENHPQPSSKPIRHEACQHRQASNSLNKSYTSARRSKSRSVS